MTAEKEIFYFELTDTFSGEANYCWLDRYKIEAHCIEDAISQLNAYTGYDFPEDESYRDRWDSRNACVCAFDVSESVYYDPSFASEFREI